MTCVVLSEVASVVRGVSFDKNDVADSPANGFVPILRAGNIEGELNIADDLVWVPERRVSSEQYMRASDIAICMSSGSQSVVGKTATLKQDWRGSVGAFCAIIRPDANRIEPDFFALFLKSDTFRAWTRQSSGANIKNIRKTELESFQIPLPSLAEQRRIVDVLAHAEGIVRLRREAQQKAAELIPALFLALFGDPATNPKHWPTRAIGELCSVQTGATPRREEARYFDGGTIPWIKTTSVIGERITSAEDYVTDSAIVETNCKVFPVGTILVAMYGQGQTRGRVGMLAIPAATNQACAAILPSDGIDQSFLFQTLRIQYERVRAMGRGGNQANLNLGMIKDLEVPVPPIELQRHFAAKAEAVRSIAARQSVALATAQSTFAALLHRAFAH